MKIVIAPDSFKESLEAADVAAAIAEGVLEVCPDAQIDLCPMADGGEGTVNAVVAATGGQFVTTDVFDPLGAPIRARLGLVGCGEEANLPGELGLLAAEMQAEGEGTTSARHIAVIEMAAASGLGLVKMEDRDPMQTTTFGTGQLILAALDAGAREIIIGIGGSATVDGGVGCAQALGVTFIDRKGEAFRCGMGGGDLADIASIDMSDLDPRLKETHIRVACDVTNPLLGSSGAAAVYGPQKGATEEMVPQLDAGLANLAALIQRDIGVNVVDLAGGGAAGGLGAGLVAFCGATLERGVEMVAQAVGLQRRLHGTDLCITGEGKFDSQSAQGKTICGVQACCVEAGVSLVCICGQLAEGACTDGFAAVRPLVADGVTPATAMRQPQALLKARTIEALQRVLTV